MSYKNKMMHYGFSLRNMTARVNKSSDQMTTASSPAMLGSEPKVKILILWFHFVAGFFFFLNVFRGESLTTGYFKTTTTKSFVLGIKPPQKIPFCDQTQKYLKSAAEKLHVNNTGTSKPNSQ